jgi:biopolymer transport protein TolR
MAFTDTNGRTRTAMAEINVTPLVDVVLVLLIIFMLTAPVLQSGIEINVPQTKTVKQVTDPRLVITIDRQQHVYLQDHPINFYDIPSALKQRVSDPTHSSVYLRADENVNFGTVASVMDAVKQAGITNISIVTQPMDTKVK